MYIKNYLTHPKKYRTKMNISERPENPIEDH